MMQLKNISKIYQKNGEQEVRALDKVDLLIEKGDFVAIVGSIGIREINDDEYTGYAGPANFRRLLSGRKKGKYL
jgi:energy-coupling factor transporter ATP-binding protein EcfA2